jgi:hypothetical protein
VTDPRRRNIKEIWKWLKKIEDVWFGGKNSRGQNLHGVL